MDKKANFPRPLAWDGWRLPLAVGLPGCCLGGGVSGGMGAAGRGASRRGGSTPPRGGMLRHVDGEGLFN